MADQVLLLIGTAGLVTGERYLLAETADVVLGRSRSCDISLRRCAGYLKAPAASRDQDHDFNTVSRRHLRVQVDGGRATLTDTSTNGSFVNDELIRQPLTADIGADGLVIRLGTRETLLLKAVAADDAQAAGLSPVAGGGPAAGDD